MKLPLDVAKRLSALRVLYPQNSIKEFPSSYASLRFRGAADSTVHQLIVEHLAKCEALLPGSSADVIGIAASGDVESSQDSFVTGLPDRGRLLSYLESAGYSKQTLELVTTAVDLAGATGKIRLETYENSAPSVELRLGHAFEVQSPLGDVAVKDCRVGVFDAFVESVQEVHHLLQEAAESGEAVVLAARAFSPDVLSTLSANMRRRSLSVWPIVCPLDERGVNTLKDVCVVTGGDLVSSDTGRLLSSIRLSSFPNCPSASWSRGTLTLGKCRDVSSHLSFLRDKSDSQEAEAMQGLYASRAASLVSRSVVIRAPDSISWSQRRQELDSCIRTASRCIAGLVEPHSADALKRRLAAGLQDILRHEVVNPQVSR